MLINFFPKTMRDLNLQINLADLNRDKRVLNKFQEIKEMLIKETEELAENGNFLLGFKDNSGGIELMENELFTIKEIENVTFIQPLESLTAESGLALESAIANNLDYFPNKRIIIIPYHIKSMTATLMTRPK